MRLFPTLLFHEESFQRRHTIMFIIFDFLKFPKLFTRLLKIISHIEYLITGPTTWYMLLLLKYGKHFTTREH